MSLNNNGQKQRKCLVELTWTQESGCLMTPINYPSVSRLHDSI
uniref:Cop9 complex subunit, putative n=1 Tax=Arundo donax TaxID=35708 RepID=A0A0A9DBP4_ARUDO